MPRGAVVEGTCEVPLAIGGVDLDTLVRVGLAGDGDALVGAALEIGVDPGDVPDIGTTHGEREPLRVCPLTVVGHDVDRVVPLLSGTAKDTVVRPASTRFSATTVSSEGSKGSPCSTTVKVPAWLFLTSSSIGTSLLMSSSSSATSQSGYSWPYPGRTLRSR